MSEPYTTYPVIPTGVITRQPGAKLKTSRDGISVLTESYKGNFNDLLTTPLSISGTTHPQFPALLVWSSEITESTGGIGILAVESRGALNALPAPTYTTDRATHNEPISTHPLWTTQIAGTPTNPLNGAIFVDPNTGLPSTSSNAVFKGWTNGSIFEGVEDYLVAGSTFSISYADYSPPDLSGVGQIATPDNAPNTPEGFFWIYIGASSSQQGNIYRIQETYLMTGGVNQAATTILYGSA